VTTKKVDGCGALAGDTMCAPQSAGDVCVEGAETRNIDGVAVTEACWAWRRDYMCHVETQATDCGDFEANPKCSFLRDQCLDDDESASGACKVTERVYNCPVPAPLVPPTKEYVCGGDIYCANGVCQEIERDASDELKDALVAMGAMDQAQKEFDPDNLSLFKGARETCHKPVFGLVNCCAGKVSGALTTAAGAAALAGGPAALAAVATQFLTVFLCSTQEKMLDVKDRMGLCHYVGSYCSSSFLGICSTKRKTYCCFQSKLTRILQEQGRPQIGKAWGSPKKEQCLGFTVDEFSRLDLSKMDFTEIYAEFLEAAKLPDEAQMASDIQAKIRAYYQENAAASTGEK
jgi:conjugal transfer mating pair stabilization protein TraN